MDLLLLATEDPGQSETEVAAADPSEDLDIFIYNAKPFSALLPFAKPV